MTRAIFIGLCLCFPPLASAFAAENAFGKAKPVVKPEHARNDHCAALYGEGYSDLAGTGACVKISGRVRLDAGVTSGGTLNGASTAPLPFAPMRASAFGTAADGAIETDVRAAVDGRPLRVFSRVRGGSGSLFLLGGPRP